MEHSLLLRLLLLQILLKFKYCLVFPRLLDLVEQYGYGNWEDIVRRVAQVKKHITIPNYLK